MARTDAGRGTAGGGEEARAGRSHSCGRSYTVTREADPQLPLWMLLALRRATPLVAFGLGLLLGHRSISRSLGMPRRRVMVALVIMSRRAERCAYQRMAGQPGVRAHVLKNIRRGWYVEDEPVRRRPAHPDLVFRGVGRPAWRWSPRARPPGQPAPRGRAQAGHARPRAERARAGRPRRGRRGPGAVRRLDTTAMSRAPDAHEDRGRPGQRPGCKASGRRPAAHPQGHRPDPGAARPQGSHAAADSPRGENCPRGVMSRNAQPIAGRHDTAR